MTVVILEVHRCPLRSSEDKSNDFLFYIAFFTLLKRCFLTQLHRWDAVNRENLTETRRNLLIKCPPTFKHPNFLKFCTHMSRIHDNNFIVMI